MGNSSRATEFTFNHGQLGEIVGYTRGSDLVQFRGIPYASLPGRFRQSVLNTTLPNVPYQALNPGPYCPQPDQPYWKYWEADLPEEHAVLPEPESNEIECLNLSLTVPKSALGSHARKLPVLVFIHGGAFVGGNHAIQLSGRGVFDGTDLVRHSIKLSQDIIVIGINYRVGALGFCASRQLLEYNALNGEDLGNYGLHDQRRALDWVNEFVAGFGGDPDNVTVQGTSAGGASCHYQSIFPNRKFRRAILASGTYLGIGPKTVDEHQPLFDAIVEAGKPGTTSNEALDVILQLQVHQLTHSVPISVCNPLIENKFIHAGGLCFNAPDDRAPDLMVGAAEYESELGWALITDFGRDVNASKAEFLLRVQGQVGSNAMLRSPSTFFADSPTLLALYGVSISNEKPTPEELQALSLLFTDVIFNVPTAHIAMSAEHIGCEGRIWLYHVEARNKYPAAHAYQRAHHGINDLFVFNVAPDQVPETDKADWMGAVKQFQRSWIEFTNGISPWEPVRAEKAEVAKLGPVFVFNDGEKSKCYDTFELARGSQTAQRWDMILQESLK